MGFQINRREFLRAVALSGIGIGMVDRSSEAKGASPARKRHNGYADEGARLTGACMNTFWDASSRMFRAPVLSAETVASDERHDRGYVLWPSLIAIHALIEGETHGPGKYTKRIAEVYAGLEQ